MSNFTTNIIGCGSATPSLRHTPSSQIIDHNGKLFMVDCGEGTQLQMRRMKIKFPNLRHIFISHLHGDHILGLPGLLSTLSLLDVTGQVHVYTFAEGIAWLREFMRISRHHASLDVVMHPIERECAVVYDDDTLSVETFPLYHGVPCVGYIFREKPKPRKIIGDMVNFHEVPLYRRAELKTGADFVKPDGTVIPNAWLTTDPEPSYSYAYCSDTTFSGKVIEAVKDVDTIYHEATYADDKAHKAKERGHSTARQAGIVAREAGAKRLIIGHYSKQYLDDEILRAEAAQEFSNVVAANEGMKIDLSKPL